jgi:hypothetical protein
MLIWREIISSFPWLLVYIAILILAGAMSYLPLQFGQIINWPRWFGNYLASLINGRSPSLFDLYVLASGGEDRADSLKEFYDWKHKTLSTISKAFLTFIFGNLALVAKKLFEQPDKTQLPTASPISAHSVSLLILAAGMLIVAELLLIMKLQKISREYLDAVKFYNLFR